jgi:membrane protein DedA with SNARE-associated domain
MDNNIIERVFEFLLYMPPAIPYVAAFLMLLVCGLGVPIPEDITLFIMGYLAFNRLADFWISVAVCMVGVLLGDSIIYWMGRHYGPRLTKKGLFARLLPPERMERTRKLFHKWGNKVIFAARFMPGLRAPTYFSAGTLHMPFRV